MLGGAWPSGNKFRPAACLGVLGHQLGCSFVVTYSLLRSILSLALLLALGLLRSLLRSLLSGFLNRLLRLLHRFLHGFLGFLGSLLGGLLGSFFHGLFHFLLDLLLDFLRLSLLLLLVLLLLVMLVMLVMLVLLLVMLALLPCFNLLHVHLDHRRSPVEALRADLQLTNRVRPDLLLAGERTFGGGRLPGDESEHLLNVFIGSTRCGSQDLHDVERWLHRLAALHAVSTVFLEPFWQCIARLSAHWMLLVLVLLLVMLAQSS